MVVIYCYLEKAIYKVLKFHVRNSSSIEKKCLPLLRLPSNKRCSIEIKYALISGKTVSIKLLDKY